jgi:two-component system OmpR family response regulator
MLLALQRDDNVRVNQGGSLNMAADQRAHLLVVDDAFDIREPLAKFLDKNGFRVTTAENAAAARARLNAEKIDLVVLDVMMPGEDGLSLCRYLSANTAVPVILLTALSEETDRVVGLEVGADDYITKPFSQRELLARIKNVLRRVTDAAAGQPEGMEGSYVFEGWTFKVGERELRNPEGVLVPITTVDFYLLSTFLAHPKDVLDRDKLLGLAHGMQPDIFDRTIDLQVSRLRRKIEPDPKAPAYIKTVRGKGYVWCIDVKRAS